MKSTKVVALSGVSGCGKTTVIKQLSTYYDCPALHFDDYVESSTYPKNMKQWYENGADVAGIQTPQFVDALSNLKESCSSYIFIEEPFGRERSCIAPLIDYVILLDQPMELCLSRVIRRNLNYSLEQSNRSIHLYLENYESYFRNIYRDKVEQVRKNCDFQITETYSLHEMTEVIVSWLIRKEDYA